MGPILILTLTLTLIRSSPSVMVLVCGKVIIHHSQVVAPARRPAGEDGAGAARRLRLPQGLCPGAYLYCCSRKPCIHSLLRQCAAANPHSCCHDCAVMTGRLDAQPLCQLPAVQYNSCG